MKKIGIMGGSFNPIHVGHLTLAQRVLDDLSLDEVWFVPTGYSYMKADAAMVSSEDRYHMTELAISGDSRMKCLDMEIKREGATYSYETLEALNAQYPAHKFYFIFGADCLFGIENWRFPQRIFGACTIVASVRNGSDITAMKTKIKELEERYSANIILYPFINLEISSTELRERVASGKSIRFLVPDEVAAYIDEKKFYREDE